MRALLSTAGALTAAGLRLGAAEPVLTHVLPAGLQAGKAEVVALAGKFDPWPCRFWSEVPGLTFTPLKAAGTVEIKVAADVPPGPHLLRAVNDEGVSGPVAFVVTREPQTAELENNDDYRKPQVLESSVATVNGRFDKSGDVDSWQVTLNAGQTMVLRMESYVLASGCDAMLRVTDARGVTLAFDHDGPSTIDPLLVFTAPESGVYVVQAMGQKYPASSDIRFAGGEDCIYRLHLSTGPVVRNTWPLAVPRRFRGPVAVEGWNLPAEPVIVDSGSLPPFPVVWSECPERTEGPAVQTLTIPSGISGRISAPGEEDAWAFHAAKGDVVKLEVTGPDQGSEIDPWLKVRDAEGKELAGNDDAGGSRDARLTWTAPAEGEFRAVVGDLTQRGGPDYFYRLGLSRPVPSVSATVSVHSVKVEAGKSAELKVSTVFADGFASPLKLTVRGLPEGVSATSPEVPAAGGDVTVTLNATEAAVPCGQPFRIVLTDADGRESAVRYPMISTSENNGVPQGYRVLLVPDTPDLWLTLTPPAAPRAEAGK